MNKPPPLHRAYSRDLAGLGFEVEGFQCAGLLLRNLN